MSSLEVQSELYNEKSTFKQVTSLNNSNSLVVLEFHTQPKDSIDFDEDGDIIVTRKKNKLQLEFSPSTTLPLVGLQIWRGAFLLADFILSHQGIFRDKNVLELGSGVGLAGIVAGIYSRETVCTDIDKGGILQLIQKNITRNQNVTKGKMSTMSLDFYQQEWSISLNRKIKQTEVIIAADVIYDDSLTEAFIDCMTKLLQTLPIKTLYLALEKRYVFTVPHLENTAPCYEYFLKCLKTKWSTLPMCNWSMREIELDFQQYFNYDRTEDLVLLEISV